MNKKSKIIDNIMKKVELTTRQEVERIFEDLVPFISKKSYIPYDGDPRNHISRYWELPKKDIELIMDGFEILHNLKRKE